MQVEKKRIFLIGAVPPPHHGTNISNERILNSRIKDIYDLYHINTSDPRDLKNLGRLDIINVFLGLKNSYNLFFGLIRKKPDLVYLVVAQNLAFLRDGLFILITRFFSRARIIIHLRSSYFKKNYDRSNWFVKRFIDFTLKQVDCAIVLGETLKYIIDRWVKNIKVVPNGTDFDPDISIRRYGMKKEIVLGFLGNLYEFKGIFDLIQALNIVIKVHPYIKLVVGGPWIADRTGFQKKVFNYIENNMLKNYIIFEGLIRDREKAHFYLGIDLFILPSWSEGHPNVILEAMAAGCPVIATKDVGAISDTVLDYKTGILVEKKNPPAIADAINYFLNKPGELKRMGIAGRKRFEKNYTMEKNISNLINVFESVLGKGKR